MSFTFFPATTTATADVPSASSGSSGAARGPVGEHCDYG